MSRSLPTAITDELKKDSLKYIDLIEVHFDSADGGTKFLTNGPYPVTLTTSTSGGSQTYLSNGEFLSFEMVNETDEARVNEINIILTGVSNTFTDLFLNNDYVERRIVIYRSFRDSNNVAIDCY